MVRLSHLYVTTGKARALTIRTFVGKVVYNIEKATTPVKIKKQTKKSPNISSCNPSPSILNCRLVFIFPAVILTPVHCTWTLTLTAPGKLLYRLLVAKSYGTTLFNFLFFHTYTIISNLQKKKMARIAQRTPRYLH